MSVETPHRHNALCFSTWVTQSLLTTPSLRQSARLQTSLTRSPGAYLRHMRAYYFNFFTRLLSHERFVVDLSFLFSVQGEDKQRKGMEGDWNCRSEGRELQGTMFPLALPRPSLHLELTTSMCNALQELPATVLALEGAVKVIDATNNRISSLPATITQLTGLQRLVRRLLWKLPK